MRVDVTKKWKRSPEDRHKFKARNGDTLDALNKQAAELTVRLHRARRALRDNPPQHVVGPIRRTTVNL